MGITGVRATVATWAMTRVELGRVFADAHGYRTVPRSNWVYSAAGDPVCAGWEEFAAGVECLGYIKVGRGIDWQACHVPSPDAHTHKIPTIVRQRREHVRNQR